MRSLASPLRTLAQGPRQFQGHTRVTGCERHTRVTVAGTGPVTSAMGCGPSMPKLDEFLVAVPAPASGFMLGDIASTAEGSVTLRFPCGVTIAGSNFAGPEPPATCPVKDENDKLLFTVYRAGAEPKSTFSPVKPLRLSCCSQSRVNHR